MTAGIGYLGFTSGGLFYAATGVLFALTCCMILIASAAHTRKLTSVMYGLVPVDVSAKEMTFLSWETEERKAIKFDTIHLGVRLLNNSSQTIFYRMRPHQVSVMGKINPDAKVFGDVSLIASGLEATHSFPLIQDVVVPPGVQMGATGIVNFEMEYGPSPDRMLYVMHFTENMYFMIEVAPGDLINVRIAGQVKKLTHSLI